MKPRAKQSSAPSPLPDWLALDLPAITDANAPVAHPPPSPALAHRHSIELLRSVPEATWLQRRAMMNPERFTMP